MLSNFVAFTPGVPRIHWILSRRLSFASSQGHRGGYLIIRESSVRPREVKIVHSKNLVDSYPYDLVVSCLSLFYWGLASSDVHIILSHKSGKASRHFENLSYSKPLREQFGPHVPMPWHFAPLALCELVCSLQGKMRARWHLPNDNANVKENFVSSNIILRAYFVNY